MRVDTIETTDLGNRSYVVSDGSAALVIDPQRDLDRVRALAASLGVSITMVLETHLHNDYVSGGHALARTTGATYVVSGREDVGFERCAAHDGDELSVGDLTVRVVSTPGHTDNHLSYVVRDRAGGSPAVFSGGSLLYGGVGRTDLLGADRTADLARKQWRSARRLASTQPDHALLYPTHVLGSFCSSVGARGGSGSTIGQEKQRNVALSEDDEQAFVDRLTTGTTDYPSYYVNVAPLNALGADEPDLTLPRNLGPAELAGRIRTGEWVVDVRDRSSYADAHLAGTVSIMMSREFSAYVGWVVPWGAPVTLVGESAALAAEARRRLARIGIDQVAGVAVGPLHRLAPQVPVRAYERATFEDVARAGAAAVLDVRRDDEVRAGHISRSRHIPLHTLVDRLREVPRGEVWVHSASGFRAGIAASILDRAGRKVVHVDDDYVNAEKAGLQTVVA